MRIRILALAGAVALGWSSLAQAVLIDFNGGTPGAAIGAFYSGSGLTFSNGAWHAPISNQAGTPSSGVFLVDVTDSGFNPPFSPTSTTAIVGTFSSPAQSVSILAVDIGNAGAQLDVYNALVGGTLIGSMNFFGVGAGVGTFTTLSVSSAGIRRFELYQPIPTSGDGLFWDNLQFTLSTVPEPSTLLLLGLGLAGLGIAKRRVH